MKRRAWALTTVVTLAAAACSSAHDGAWRVLAEMPEPRTEVTGANVDGTIYALGGLSLDAAGRTIGSSRVDAYHPATDSWTRAPDLPVPLHHTAAVALGSRLVVVGGYTLATFTPVPTTWVLDTSVQTPAWQPFVPLPEPRGAHAAVTDGERIFVFGGVGVDGIVSSAHVLDDGATAWRAIADMPDAREHLAGAFLGDKVYAAGGRFGGLETNTARVDVYDPATDSWARAPDLPTARGGNAAAALDGRVIVVGGEANEGTFSETEAYDPSIEAWASLDPMPTARHGLAAVTGEDGVHVIAGGPEPGLYVSGAHELLRASA